MKAHFLQLKVC